MRYRLPEALGGGEVEGTITNGGLWFSIPGCDSQARIPAELVVLVERPEPPLGSIILDGKGYVWKAMREHASGVLWQTLTGGQRRWRDIDHPTVSLVPDPLAQAPELPWVGSSWLGAEITIDRDGNRGDIHLGVRPAKNDVGLGWILPPDVAHAMGLALLKAAADGAS